MENNVQQVVDLLNDISKVATIVQDNDLADLYIAQGGATLGKEMPEKDFLEAEHKVLKIMDALKDIHREVVQNIENKYISGLEDAVEALNKVNEGKNQYKSDHLTYEEKTTTYINNGLAGPVEQTSTDTKHFTLSDILNSDKSPIPVAAAKYNEKLKVAKERLKKLEQSDKETYNKIKDLTDRELVDSFYPTEMGEYKRLKSTWSKDNEQWLGWVENGVKIVGVGLLVVGSIASGGTLAPVAFGTGTALLGGEALYRAGVGETISGDVLSTEQRWWAGAEAVTTLASGGLSTATKVAGTTASESLLAAEKVAHISANVYDVAQFGHDFMDDPQMALTNLATSQMIGRTIGHLGNKYKAYRASQTGNVDIRSGEATSFKANIKERANTAWTDIKTKAGDVKVQAGESFENFKNRVSNVKNQAISASTEGLSNKVRNFSDAIETGRQNIHNTLDSLGNKNRLAFVTVDDVPVDLPKSKISSKMDDLADRIQQISVEHKQKIEAFEGRGGGSRNVSTPHSDASSLETSNWGSDALSDLRKKWNVPETDTIAVGKTDIPGLEDRVFEGGSPKVRKEAGLPDLDEAFPDRTVRSPFNNPRARNHAEEGIFAQFEEAVQHMDPEKVKGTLEMHQSNPSGVCTSCISGITNDAAKEGIFLQFSKKYPDLKIMVISVEREGVRKVGRLNFTIQNGKYLK
ncbi:hypothetical protein [Streptococcus gordonii]|uniref:hypothetical protein n=1 Tax=Streptococcus gordonii TaxID=1302 RepID=UPI0010D1C6EA|nr:hypothetical protein [Streptococcus gordonii]VTS25343.1 Uncharacterised protein [Streptococcus gordonii]